MWEGGPESESAALTVSLHLCSYYPLYPPQEDMAIDYESFYAYAQLPVTPDVLIVPSELRYFVKVRLDSAFPRQARSVSDFPFQTTTPTLHGSADRDGGRTRKKIC